MFIFDETFIIGHNWAFGPCLGTPDTRGYNCAGSEISLTSESFAWTFLVR